MKKELLYKKLSTIFDLDVKKIKPDLLIESIRNWDSLKYMQLIFFIEKEIKKHLTSKEIDKIKKVLDIEKITKSEK
jgi:acyl carrier protein|tara:strand:- start:2798 stop:3025 length:228 start_codon:yes stop_codon:yes gene_type:complete